jgi:hypothetical protein
MKHFVTIFISTLLLFACSKTHTPAPSPTSHTSDMGGSRVWHGPVDGVSYGTSFSYILVDTFSFVIVDDSNIKILNNVKLGIDSCTLKLSATDTAAKTLTFNTTKLSGSGFPIPYMVIYYYSAGSIYFGGNGTGISGWKGVQLRTP